MVYGLDTFNKHRSNKKLKIKPSEKKVNEAGSVHKSQALLDSSYQNTLRNKSKLKNQTASQEMLLTENDIIK